MIDRIDMANTASINNRMIRENAQKNEISPIEMQEIIPDKIKPIQDEYISSKDKEEEHTGLYKVVYDENGNKKIVYDKIEPKAPEVKASKAQKPQEKGASKTKQAAQGEENRKDVGDTKKAKKKREMGYVNTDAVDREIEALKKKRKMLLKTIASLRNEDMSKEAEVKLKALQKELEQVERELMQKDNDRYRKQNASFSKGVEVE